jgi:hypothetical protein
MRRLPSIGDRIELVLTLRKLFGVKELGFVTLLALGFSSPMFGGPWHAAAAFLAYCVLFVSVALDGR